MRQGIGRVKSTWRLAEWDMIERWSDTWPGSSRAVRMTRHWVDPKKLWLWEKEAENSGVLGLEGVDRSTEAGRVWAPGSLHGHRASNQIPRGFHAKKKPLWGEAPAVWLQPQPVLTNTWHKSTTTAFPLASFPKRSKSCFSQYNNYGAGETVLWSSTYWTRKRTWAWISRTHWEPDSEAHTCNPSSPTVGWEAEPGESLRWARLPYAVARRGLGQDERQVPTLEAVPWRYSRYMFSPPPYSSLTKEE